MAAANGKAKEFYEDEKNLNKLCNFLRSAEGPAVREAVMMDKRVYYIKGKEVLCVDDVVSIAGGCFSGLYYYQFYTRSSSFILRIVLLTCLHARHINMSTLQERSL